jgi:hypothetical protein
MRAMIAGSSFIAASTLRGRLKDVERYGDEDHETGYRDAHTIHANDHKEKEDSRCSNTSDLKNPRQYPFSSH